MSGLPEAEVTLEVPFFDADMLGIVWHGHYLKYFEIARCALLEIIDYDYLTMKATGYVWPVVDLQVRYLAPARFGQTLQVAARMLEYEYRLKLAYEIHDTDGRRLAKGTTVQVAVELDSGEMCFGSPPVLLERIARWRRQRA
ncbi:acyl-CoA thioester hydrolase [Methylomarinovum tepidoasis]|uniref:Acyl-CoA thioester hydrolase n=1 Tax=Methylomarinovum tepidoasis TaxID=2840183 RepID=A0AAU9C1M7_9GAMM|nr:acyl-CoA thioester hydrolase [Methylomarinovum sp. IN45]